MKNLEYSEIKNEQESPFDVISTDNSFADFSDYVDSREDSYIESTVTEVWKWDFESTVTETDGMENYYDELENKYNNSEYDSKYVRMKNYNVKGEWELWSLSSATNEEVVSVLNDNEKVAHSAKTVKMNLAGTLEDPYYSNAA